MPVITNPVANIPVNAKSHTHGWTQVWAHHLGATIDHKCSAGVADADMVFIDHGANFSGNLNLFGGATDEIYNRFNIVASCRHLVSLDWDMPDFGAMLKKRIGAKTTSDKITEEWCDRLSSRLSYCKSIKQQDLDTYGVTLGDSHTIAFSRAQDSVLRNDGKTLYGALQDGLSTMFRGTNVRGEITLCFGSIDIRHHLARPGNNGVDDLITEYVRQGLELETQYECPVRFAAPVPVEFEGRRIPKSGFYKGEPFYGSREVRLEITMRFIDQIKKMAGEDKIVCPPADWYDMDPECYAKTIMEHGSSFHIAPPFYRRLNWGQ